MHVLTMALLHYGLVFQAITDKISFISSQALAFLILTQTSS